jgi:hypothetical protein
MIYSYRHIHDIYMIFMIYTYMIYPYKHIPHIYMIYMIYIHT